MHSGNDILTLDILLTKVSNSENLLHESDGFECNNLCQLNTVEDSIDLGGSKRKKLKEKCCKKYKKKKKSACKRCPETAEVVA
tara:strand:+ start:323 stop:571 length:249 start_codon:yes stop_codon:yes gene_type:complete